MRLRYWIKEALKLSALAILATLFYTAMMAWMNEENNWKSSLNMGAIYLTMFGGFMGMMQGIAVYQVHVPLAISFGATRKEVLWGIHCYRLVITVLLLAVAGVMCALAEELWIWGALLAGICLFLVFNGMGAILGSFSNRLGKTAVILTMIGALLLLAGAVAVVVIGQNLLQMHGVLFSALLLGLSILVYALCMGHEVKAIRKFSVR